MHKILVPSLIALIPFCVQAEFAFAEENEFTLGTVVVTANALDKSGDADNSIDTQKIRAYDKETVGGALNTLSGISISKVGARNEEMVYVRGFDLRQVPVFVDGVPVYVPYDGYADLGRFNTFDLARIDVAKGFSSLIYGPNTLGGAINLVSRRPSKTFEGEIGGGSTITNDGDNNGNRIYTNIGSNQGSWYVQAGLSYLKQDYYQLPDDFVPAKGEDGDRRDNSATTDRKYNLKIALTPNDTDEYSLNYISQHGEKGTPPYAGSVAGVTPRYWTWPYWDKDSLYYISSTEIGIATLKVRAFHDTYGNSLFAWDDATYSTQKKASSFQSWYDDYTNGASVEVDFQLGDKNILKSAYHWKEDLHREHNLGEPIRRDEDRTQSIALEDTHNFTDDLSLVAGVSHDWRDGLQAEDYNTKTKVISDFKLGEGNANNATLGLFDKITDTGKIHFTIAQKSRFPTIKDRYSYRMGTALPNPDLKAESALHYDIGYEDTFYKMLHVNISVFHSDVTDLIQVVSIPASACSTPPCSQMQNIGKVDVDGVDTSVRADFGSLNIGAAYSYLDRKNLSDSAVHLIDTPRHKFVGDAVWHITPTWNATASFEASSSRYTTTNGVQQTGGFGIANLKTGYRFADEKLLVEAGVRNMFDRLYEYTEGFPEAGRTYFLQFKYSL
ncbi:MAG: TonB-dependent receptor [Gammaproteobacteria bacterium]|nr:MAG: TonB-dependent receptor [Gammaproteobacteria bacterium]